MLSGDISTKANRADLGGHAPRKVANTENIVQIAWPTDLTSLLDENEAIRAGRAISDALYGEATGTFSMDMNQFLVKAPGTDTDTPWHMDQSYYIPLRDPRGCNIWLALEGGVTEDNGCLWFEKCPLDDPLPLRTHWPAGGGGGALQCEGPPLSSATPAPLLRAGSVTVHSHLTPHYANGNSTTWRRAGYVVQTRPSWSVAEARAKGFDHGRFAGNTPRLPSGDGEA